MPSNSNDIIQAANELASLQDQVSLAIANVNDLIDSLAANPSQPGAQKKYIEIVNIRQETVSNPWNNSAPSLVTNLNDTILDATQDARIKTEALVSNVNAKQGTITIQGKTQRDVALPNLLKKITEAKSFGNVDPTSNLLLDTTSVARLGEDTAGLAVGVVGVGSRLGINLNNPNTGSNQPAGQGLAPTTSKNIIVGPGDGDNLPTPVATQAGVASGVAADLSNPAFSPAKDSQAAYLQGSSSGKTTVDAGNVISTTNSPSLPGVRLQNPLGNFASYTYNLSLYMVTPEAYNAFILTGRKNVYANKEGVFLVAQSGGISNNTQRAPGFELDYYIDDLKIVTKTSGKSSLTATNVTDLSFNIYEPYGFSFFGALRKAALAVATKTSIPGASQSKNALKQFFILAIRFTGYDDQGKVITSADIAKTTQTNNFLKGIQEKFFDISIVDVKFKLDGKMSTYRITARSLAPFQSFGIKRGRIDHRFSITANDVANSLIGPEGLLTKLNEEQVELTKKINPQTGKPAMEYPNIYKIRFIGDDSIKKAKLVTKDKFRFPSANVSKTIQSNAASAANSVPDPTKLQITFENDTPIQLAIANIITQSSYMEDALTVMYVGLEPSDNPNDPDVELKSKNATFNWYNLSAEINPYKFDTILNDWAYEITYVIQPYKAPNIVSPYAAKLPKYYGPHKRYTYWYTGKNTEVINFEQELNNAYFMVALNPNSTPATVDAGVSMKAGIRPNEVKTGGRNVELEAQNSILSDLYSPKDWAESKITILGDPDFLVQDSPGSVNDAYNQFYGTDGVTINPNGGQVFIEVDFKEGVDYKDTNGVMSLNQTLTFWQDYGRLPSELRSQIKGISFLVIEVTSDFSKGKFTQVLSLRLNVFPQIGQTSNTAQQSFRQSEIQQQTAAGARTTSSQANNASGSSEAPSGATTMSDLLPDQPYLTDYAYGSPGETSDSFLQVGRVYETNQVTSPIKQPNFVTGTPESATTYAGISTRPIIVEGLDTTDQAIVINSVVADDDGSVDVINQVIVDKSSKPDYSRTDELAGMIDRRYRMPTGGFIPDNFF